MTPRKLVVLESPFAASPDRTRSENVAYAKRCMWHSIRKSEAPIASHLLYTQPMLLDDDIPNERSLGISLGISWGMRADLVAVYIDHGITNGMQVGIDSYRHHSIPVEYRTLLSNEPVTEIEANGKVPK